jgi:hypothetical protein
VPGVTAEQVAQAHVMAVHEQRHLGPPVPPVIVAARWQQGARGISAFSEQLEAFLRSLRPGWLPPDVRDPIGARRTSLEPPSGWITPPPANLDGQDVGETRHG